MSGRLDDLFSPERLRDKWQEPATPEPAAGPAPTSPDAPQLLLDELGRLLSERFDDQALRTLVVELRERLERCFPAEGKPPPEEERATLRGEIEERLDLLEDLTDALSLPRRRL